MIYSHVLHSSMTNMWKEVYVEGGMCAIIVAHAM